jgi:hypothetical protein
LTRAYAVRFSGGDRIDPWFGSAVKLYNIGSRQFNHFSSRQRDFKDASGDGGLQTIEICSFADGQDLPWDTPESVDLDPNPASD